MAQIRYLICNTFDFCFQLCIIQAVYAKEKRNEICITLSTSFVILRRCHFIWLNSFDFAVCAQGWSMGKLSRFYLHFYICNLCDWTMHIRKRIGWRINLIWSNYYPYNDSNWWSWIYHNLRFYCFNLHKKIEI